MSYLQKISPFILICKDRDYILFSRILKCVFFLFFKIDKSMRFFRTVFFRTVFHGVFLQGIFLQGIFFAGCFFRTGFHGVLHGVSRGVFLHGVSRSFARSFTEFCTRFHGVLHEVSQGFSHSVSRRFARSFTKFLHEAFYTMFHEVSRRFCFPHG
jgi:hypothetical protein